MMWTSLCILENDIMPNDKQRLGMLGSGMAAKAGKQALDQKRKKKNRLDDIMGSIRSSRAKPKN